MEFRWYQREAVDAVWQHLRQGLEAGNPVINAPTGSGKSVMIAELARACVQDWQGQALILAHRKELLEQNAEKVKALLPFGVTCGIYSSGLRRYSMDDPIICCGIQSVYKKAAAFGRRHLVIVDEAHLIPTSDDGMYRKFLSELKEINPKLRIVGLTATPYRTGEGTICKADNIFHKICYSVPIQRLIAEGYLCQITSTPARHEVNTSGLHRRGGEFIEAEMQALFDGADKVLEACKEIASVTANRKSVIAFCAGVIHAGHVADMLRKITGERTEVITGETLPIERDAILKAFKRQEVKYLCNVDVLTTGFDAPCIDAIAVLRATLSPGLFAQMVGRGFRIHEAKQDCLVLDFGENIKRHGPIDSPDYGKRASRTREEIESSEGVPGKQCPGCGENVSGNTRKCECGYLFPANHEANSTSESVLSTPVTWRVKGVHMGRWQKKKAAEDAPDTLRVDYTVTPLGNEDTEIDLQEQTISEWVCLEHPPGFALTKAKAWWIARTIEEFQPDIEFAIQLFNCGGMAQTLEITTVKDGRFDRITKVVLGDKPTAWGQPEEDTRIVLGWDEWGEPIYEEVLEPVSSDDDMPF